MRIDDVPGPWNNIKSLRKSLISLIPHQIQGLAGRAPHSKSGHFSPSRETPKPRFFPKKVCALRAAKRRGSFYLRKAFSRQRAILLHRPPGKAGRHSLGQPAVVASWRLNFFRAPRARKKAIFFRGAHTSARIPLPGSTDSPRPDPACYASRLSGASCQNHEGGGGRND